MCKHLKGFPAFTRNATAGGRLQPLRWIWPTRTTTCYLDQTLVCICCCSFRCCLCRLHSCAVCTCCATSRAPAAAVAAAAAAAAAACRSWLCKQQEQKRNRARVRGWFSFVASAPLRVYHNESELSTCRLIVLHAIYHHLLVLCFVHPRISQAILHEDM